MPTSAELALVLRFRDEATAAMKTATQGIGQTLANTGRAVEEIGLQMRRVSRELLQVGVVITGAFTLAFAQAAQHIPAVGSAIESFTHQVLAMQETIASAAVPVLNQLALLFKGMNEAISSMDPTMRDMIIRGTLVVGVLALISGTVGRLVADFALLIGRILTWSGALLLAHPYLVLIGIAVGVLITVMGGWQNAILLVGRAIDVLVEALKILWDLLRIGIEGALWAIIAGLEGMAKAAELFGGKIGAWAKGAADDLEVVRNKLQKDVVGSVTDAGDHLGTLIDRFQHGGGAAEHMAGSIVKMADTIKNAMKGNQTVIHDFFGKLSDDLSAFWVNFTNWGKQATTLITQGVTSLESGFTKLYTSILDGSESSKNIFKDFGKVVIDTIVQMIAKMMALATIWIIVQSLMGFGGGIGAVIGMAHGATSAIAAASGLQTIHQGGLVQPGIQRFQTGGEVLAMVQPGEFVVNRQAASQNRSLLDQINQGQMPSAGSGPGSGMMNVQNVFIIQAIDTKSFRDTLQQHADLVEAMFQRAMRRNSGPMREAVRV